MIRDVQAIDVHAHLGAYTTQDATYQQFMSGDAARVAALAERAHTAITVVSGLRAFFPEGAYDILAGNEDARQAAEREPRLRVWAVFDPRVPAVIRQVEALLTHPACVGIKIHPELHEYPITDYGRAIFGFAARHRAVVQTHSGQERTMPLDYLPFADAFPEVTLLLSHNGFCWNGDLTQQVRAVQRSRHGNVYTDTSSAKSVIPQLHEWTVREVGADKLLYGTDSPLYFAPMQRARLDAAEMGDAEKQRILRGNAERILGLGE